MKEAASETIAYDPYEWTWECPLCEEEVVYVQEGADGTTAHFRHKSKTDHPKISEGELHRKAKKEIKRKLERDNQLREIELEKVIDQEDSRVADIYLETREGYKIAVEIQCSSQTQKEFEQRTKDYTDKGIYTLWILNSENYRYEKRSKNSSGIEKGVCFKKSVKWLQRHYYGRSYFLDPETLEIQPGRITRKEVIREGLEGDYIDTLKTIGDISTSQIPNYGLAVTESNSLKIARFYDRCWWKS